MNDVNVQRCFKYLGVHVSVKMYFLKISMVHDMFSLYGIMIPSKLEIHEIFDVIIHFVCCLLSNHFVIIAFIECVSALFLFG